MRVGGQTLARVTTLINSHPRLTVPYQTSRHSSALLVENKGFYLKIKARIAPIYREDFRASFLLCGEKRR